MVQPMFILEALLVIGAAASVGIIVGLHRNQILSKSDKVKTFLAFATVYCAVAISIFLCSKLFLL